MPLMRHLRVFTGLAIATMVVVTTTRSALLLHTGEPAVRVEAAAPRREEALPHPAPNTGADAAVVTAGIAAVQHTPPLLLDGSIEKALAMAVPQGTHVVLLTFGDSGVMSMLRNFASHARAAGAPFVVGAVDAAAYKTLALESMAAYKTPLAMNDDYVLDGSNAHASSSWQEFAKMRTGEVARIVALGYDVLHTDVDVVWLRNPAPYVTCVAESRPDGVAPRDPAPIACESLRAADVAVSSDNMSPGRDASGGLSYAIGGTLNTGILLVRATAAGVRFAADWHATVIAYVSRMRTHAACITGAGTCHRLSLLAAKGRWSRSRPGRRSCPKGSVGDCNQGRCCTSDQQVLN